MLACARMHAMLNVAATLTHPCVFTCFVRIRPVPAGTLQTARRKGTGRYGATERIHEGHERPLQEPTDMPTCSPRTTWAPEHTS